MHTAPLKVFWILPLTLQGAEDESGCRGSRVWSIIERLQKQITANRLSRQGPSATAVAWSACCPLEVQLDGIGKSNAECTSPLPECPNEQHGKLSLAPRVSPGQAPHPCLSLPMDNLWLGFWGGTEKRVPNLTARTQVTYRGQGRSLAGDISERFHASKWICQLGMKWTPDLTW